MISEKRTVNSARCRYFIDICFLMKNTVGEFRESYYLLGGLCMVSFEKNTKRCHRRQSTYFTVDYASGTYFVTLQYGKEVQTKKLIVTPLSI